MTEDMVFTMTDEDGNLRPKEDVIKDLEEIYDTLVDKDKQLEAAEGKEYFSLIANNEHHVDIDSLLSTDEFFQRSIYINQIIDDEIAQRVHHFIKLYNDVDVGSSVDDRIPINIYINTDGGDLDAARSIISSISISETPVITWNMGKAYSAGFFILISGHIRMGMPHSSYLLHEGSTAIYTDAHKFFQYSEHYKQLLDELRSFTLENTKITPDYYDSQKPNDVWFTANRAKELGVIDEIAESI